MMEKTYDILCVGTALIDSIIRCFDPNPVSATGYRAKSASLHAGGEAVNTSMAAAKLGMKTGIFCYLGDDTAGRFIESELERCGVDTGSILHSGNHPTPVTTMFVNADGTRKSIANDAHFYNFHPEQYPEILARGRAALFGSLFRAPFDDPEAVFSAVKTVRESGAVIAADTKLPNFRPLVLEDFRDSLPWIDYITPNQDEAEFLTGKKDPEEMAGYLLNAGVRNVILKLGAEGCLFMNHEKTIRLPAYPVRAVDATGAGDQLLAGFVSELLAGKGVEEALFFGNACGAICTTAAGAAAALKDRQQVLDFMSCYEGVMPEIPE